MSSQGRHPCRPWKRAGRCEVTPGPYRQPGRGDPTPGCAAGCQGRRVRLMATTLPHPAAQPGAWCAGRIVTGRQDVTEITLPPLPEPGAPITADEVAELERRITKAIAAVSNADTLLDWRAKAAALEIYLRSRGLQAPMLGAQRRVEGRIGQLLGDNPERNPVLNALRTLDDMQRRDFRLLARALSGELTLAPEQWQKSRAALAAHVRKELGLMPPPPHPPDP